MIFQSSKEVKETNYTIKMFRKEIIWKQGNPFYYYIREGIKNICLGEGEGIKHY